MFFKELLGAVDIVNTALLNYNSFEDANINNNESTRQRQKIKRQTRFRFLNISKITFPKYGKLILINSSAQIKTDKNKVFYKINIEN